MKTTLAQRIVLFAGSLAAFHSSLVPPVKQAGGELCRYHEFLERGWPFTRTFGTEGVDGIALLTEYGILTALCTMAWLIVGALAGRRKDAGSPGPV